MENLFFLKNDNLWRKYPETVLNISGFNQYVHSYGHNRDA